MKSKKKLLTSVAALTLAAATLLGGTFAWQSISQTALNESTDAINPGGRLHNDIASAGPTETLNYIYVENFTDEGGEDIYARIRLEEYMELVMNYGVEDVEVVKNVAGVKTPKTGSSYDADDATRQNEFDYTYELHLFGDDMENATDDYWTWILGAEERNATRGSYMPTFNKNKDSLAADQNGSYTMAIGGIIERNSNYNMDETAGGFAYYFDKAEDVTNYGYGTHTKTAYAIYDNDGNQLDELAGLSDADLKDIIANGTGSEKWQTAYGDAVHLESETHTAKRIGNTSGTISMEDWLALLEESENGYDANVHGGYWVYDTDGWVYWSSPIKSGETTGPLLEGFLLNHEMNDTWYYAINVEAQFITADDLGAADNTGFYDENGWYDPAGLGEDKAAAFAGMGQAPSENALTLLGLIGVDTGEANSSAGGGQTETATDWSTLVTMRNITLDEYDALIEVTNGDDDTMHWANTVASWTSTQKTTGYYVCGGFANVAVDYTADWYSGFTSSTVGMRPAFAAQDLNDCADLSEGDTVVIGTLYMGETAIKVPTNIDSSDGDITSYDQEDKPAFTLRTALNDTDYQMKAIYIGNGVFVCDRCMINNISLDQINNALAADTSAE